jgi:EAL domain-containing protein (putative c-di-GMP-specific phosphodiesterase class I)
MQSEQKQPSAEKAARNANWMEKRCVPLDTLVSEAVIKQELEVHYQPQYELECGLGCGVEALARWTLPDGEEISPTIFIPIAERTGMICPLGDWVLQRACETVAGWGELGGLEPTLSVNVSTHQITEDFCGVIERVIKATGFPGHRLELEITESALIGNAEEAIDCFESWRALGVHIAVDDFGTGYSSLSYLSRLPIDRLKLDRSFVQRMMFEKKTAAIVRSVLALGKELGITVLAEGIETEGQFAMLQRLGCEQVQGFLFAKPVPAREARALLSTPWGRRLAPIFRPELTQSRGLHAV